jgi:purine-binding chemotaxis protein CheW
MSRVRRQNVANDRGFVACSVGPATYAIGIEHVQEIVIPARLSPLPEAPLGLIGAVDHRGEVVPILDLALRLGFERTTHPKRKWILVRIGGRLLGVVVAQVFEVFRVDQQALRPAPAVGQHAVRTSTQVVAFDSEIAYVLDTDSLAQLAELRPEPAIS